MKQRRTINSSHGFAAAGATLLLAATNGHAQFLSNFYVGADGGAALQQPLEILNNTGFGGSGGWVKFETGWRAGGDIGYNFCQYFAGELDSGVIWNNLTTVGVQGLPGIAAAHLEEVPLLANGIFSYPIGPFKPYIEAGAGVAFGIFDSSGIPGSGPGAVPNYHDTDATFAYQAEIGFKYSVSKNIDLGLAYKFFGTTDHNWNDNSINLRTSGTMAHTIEASFTWRF